MTKNKQRTIDKRLIEPPKLKIKKRLCKFCGGRYKDIKKHYESCEEHQKDVDKTEEDQKNITVFFEQIDRQSIEIVLIRPNSWNVNSMSQKDYEKLKESIRITKGEYLKTNPIQIREIEKGEYEIIDGEHRWRGCKELGFTHIPVIIENNVDIEKAKVLNVIQSRNRGREDYFKLSKLLNEEYKDENGKKKCTQPQLAERFGFQIGRIKKIIHIYPKLKNLLKSSPANFFENTHLQELSWCKNELLREKLIEQSIKNKWTSKEIRSHSSRLNDFDKYLEKNYNKSTKKYILDDFVGNSLFNLKVDLEEKVFNFIEKYDNLEYFIRCKNKFEREFILHSRDAERFKDKYVKDHNGNYTNWYNTYTRSPEFRTPSLMSWKFFTEFYHENVICIRCGRKIKNFNQYTPHHDDDYEFRDNHLWHIFLEGDQKIIPCHTKCHQKGSSKNWNKN